MRNMEESAIIEIILHLRREHRVGNIGHDVGELELHPEYREANLELRRRALMRRATRAAAYDGGGLAAMNVAPGHRDTSERAQQAARARWAA